MTGTPPTVTEYLAVLDPADPAALIRHFTDQYRAAHLSRFNVDPGDQVLNMRLADQVLDLTTVTICRHCEQPRPNYLEDTVDCDHCGRGTQDTPCWTVVPSMPLPVSLGGEPQKRCVDCGAQFVPPAYFVERRLSAVQTGPACPVCARSTPETTAWQTACDITAVIDVAMQQATDGRQRRLIAAHLAQVASHFAGWRWPEDGEATP